MPNKPRPENPPRDVRVEDELWAAFGAACAAAGTNRSAVIREAIVAYVEQASTSEGDQG